MSVGVCCKIRKCDQESNKARNSHTYNIIDMPEDIHKAHNLKWPTTSKTKKAHSNLNEMSAKLDVIKDFTSGILIQLCGNDVAR